MAGLKSVSAEGTDWPTVAVIIPCHRVGDRVFDVLAGVPDFVSRVFVVDDCCPEHTGDRVTAQISDERVIVLKTPKNLGVGGAVLTGFRAALEEGIDILVKLDGDGQMDPNDIERLVEPITSGATDYAKGNRFFALNSMGQMPFVRLLGNACLSFLSKMSSGYWDVFDPTNGFIAIHSAVARILLSEDIESRYFFESDMLFHLSRVNAVVLDVPQQAQYGDETSGINLTTAVVEFTYKHSRNFLRRIVGRYFIRDFSPASLSLLVGVAGVIFGVAFGGYHWWLALESGIVTATGTIMVAALPTIIGTQLLLGFATYDVRQVPRRPIHLSLPNTAKAPSNRQKQSAKATR